MGVRHSSTNIISVQRLAALCNGLGHLAQAYEYLPTMNAFSRANISAVPEVALAVVQMSYHFFLIERDVYSSEH